MGSPKVDAILDLCQKYRWHMVFAGIIYIALSLAMVVVVILAVIPHTPQTKSDTLLMILAVCFVFNSITVLFLIPALSIPRDKRTPIRIMAHLVYLLLGVFMAVGSFFPLAAYLFLH